MEPQQPQINPSFQNEPPQQTQGQPEAEQGSITDLTEPFAWDAPEGVQSQNSTMWYIIFGLITIGLMALSIFALKSLTFAVLIPVMAVALVLQQSRPVKIINYAISPKGIYVADKLYDFSEFRAFGLLNDRGQHSAILLPVKRFSPGLTIYFSDNEGETIVDMLGARLPMQEVKPDALEKLLRLIKL